MNSDIQVGHLSHPILTQRVSGRSGPTQPCYQNDGVLTFFLVVVNAGSGQVVDLVGSNAKADGRPLPRGVRVACPRPPSPSS